MGEKNKHIYLQNGDVMVMNPMLEKIKRSQEKAEKVSSNDCEMLPKLIIIPSGDVMM